MHHQVKIDKAYIKIVYNKRQTGLRTTGRRTTRKIMFEENYLHDIPRDIQEMIMDISKRRYCDIYISFWNNYSNTKDSFISKRMNRNILKYSQTIKNVEIDSEQFVNIESYASAILKSHITRLVSNLKKPAIRKILYDNDIYDAKITYEKNYVSEASEPNETGEPNETDAIDDYEKALLIEIIYYNYYYKVFIITHEI